VEEKKSTEIPSVAASEHGKVKDKHCEYYGVYSLTTSWGEIGRITNVFSYTQYMVKAQ